MNLTLMFFFQRNEGLTKRIVKTVKLDIFQRFWDLPLLLVNRRLRLLSFVTPRREMKKKDS